MTTVQATDPALRDAEAELAKAQKELAWELAKAAADAAGIIDPTPISDGVSAAMSAAEGDVVGVGLSLLSMVPYVGDAVAKTAKGARAAKRLAALRKRVAALMARVKMLRKKAEGAAKGAPPGKKVPPGKKAPPAKAAAGAVDIGMKHLRGKGKAILNCPAKQPMIEAAVKHCGINRSAAARLLEVAEKKKVVIRMRPTNEDALKWINKGHPPKPESLKMKTINEVDELIGGPKNSRGLVGFFKPVHPDAVAPELKRQNPDLYKKALDRYKQRKKEFADYRAEVLELDRGGEIRVDHGVVVQAASGKGFTGDNDIFDIRNADGTPLSKRKYKAVLHALKKPPVSAQHGAHMSWDRKGDPKKEEIFQSIVRKHMAKDRGGDGEALAEFGPGGYKKSYAGPAELAHGGGK